MRRRISIRGGVRPSVRPSVGPSVSIREKQGLGASYVRYPTLLNFKKRNLVEYGSLVRNRLGREFSWSISLRTTLPGLKSSSRMSYVYYCIKSWLFSVQSFVVMTFWWQDPYVSTSIWHIHDVTRCRWRKWRNSATCKSEYLALEST